MGRGDGEKYRGLGAQLRRTGEKPEPAPAPKAPQPKKTAAVSYLLEEDNGLATLYRVWKFEDGNRTTEKLTDFHAVGSIPETLAALGHLAASNYSEGGK